MDSCQFSMMISAVACCITKGRSCEENALLAAFFVQLGDTIATIVAHDDICGCCDCNETEEK